MRSASSLLLVLAAATLIVASLADGFSTRLLVGCGLLAALGVVARISSKDTI